MALCPGFTPSEGVGRAGGWVLTVHGALPSTILSVPDSVAANTALADGERVPLMASLNGIQVESAQVVLCLLETQAGRDELLRGLIWDKETSLCSNNDGSVK